MKLRTFEWYIKYVWPMHRKLVRGLSQRCRCCIVSERYTPLDGNGVCPACNKANQAGIISEASDAGSRDRISQFDRMIRGYAKKGKCYDALLLLSGGKDSAYILHRLCKTYPHLRILGVVVDNGFMSSVAIPNAMHVANKLDVDLVVIRSEREKFKKKLRNAFLNIKGSDAYKVVDFTDGSLIFEIGKKVAVDFGIPVMVAGLSWVQLKMIAGVDSFEIQEDGPSHLICPLAAWRPDEQDVRAYVRQNDLMQPGTDSPLASNSDLLTPMCVVDILNMGYCSFEAEFAQLVREKKTARRLWLNIFELMEYGVKTGRLIKEAERTLQRLNLTLSDVTTAALKSELHA